MSQNQLTSAPQNLSYNFILNNEDPYLKAFLDACGNNDAAFALQLSPNRDAGLLTFGLNRAVKYGHLALARQLLERETKWDYQTVNLASKSLDAIKLLVEFGFDVNTPLIAGNTLLPMVVEYNDEACIRYLLERGADPNLGPPMRPEGPLNQILPIHESGWALNRAAIHCSPQIFALLLSYGADMSFAMPLHCVVSHVSGDGLPVSNMPMLEYLVEIGFDVNAMDDGIKVADNGCGQHGTPLNYAILWGRVEEAKWLLKNGADPDKRPPWPYGLSARDRVNRLPSGDEFAIAMRAAFELHDEEL